MESGNRLLSLKDLSFTEFVNTFSLMVVLGAASTSYFFVQYFHADVPVSLYWVIASGVWIIYTVDHLIDGIKLGDSAVFLRHAIHYQYRNVLIPTLFAIAAFDVYLVFQFFPYELIRYGLVLLAFVIVYFGLFSQWKSKLAGTVKEVYIAAIVAFGMVLYPGLCGDFGSSWTDVTILAIFALLNYSNLLIFTYFDHEGDQSNSLLSGSQSVGPDIIRNRIYMVLASVFTLLTMYAFFIQTDQKISATISVLVMLNILLLTLQFEDRFRSDEAFRFWGDFIFIVPTPIYFFIDSTTLFPV